MLESRTATDLSSIAPEPDRADTLAMAPFDVFHDDPVGRFTAVEGATCFSTGDLVGVVLSASLEVTSARLILELARPLLSAAPHVVLIDGARLAHVEPAGLKVFADYVEAHRSALGGCVVRLAGVRPPSLPLAAMVEGFHRVVKPPYPWAIFESRASALAWLGCAHHRAAVDKADASARTSATSIATRLRASLEANPRYATVEDAAQTLSVSTRTVQRKLRLEGTSFETELNRARIRVAQRLILGTKKPLGQVAADVGCSGPHFSVLFRRLTGQSPSEWRSQHLR